MTGNVFWKTMLNLVSCYNYTSLVLPFLHIGLDVHLILIHFLIVIFPYGHDLHYHMLLKLLGLFMAINVPKRSECSKI